VERVFRGSHFTLQRVKICSITKSISLAIEYRKILSRNSPELWRLNYTFYRDGSMGSLFPDGEQEEAYAAFLWEADDKLGNKTDGE